MPKYATHTPQKFACRSSQYITKLNTPSALLQLRLLMPQRAHQQLRFQGGPCQNKVCHSQERRDAWRQLQLNILRCQNQLAGWIVVKGFVTNHNCMSQALGFDVLTKQRHKDWIDVRHVLYHQHLRKQGRMLLSVHCISDH